jgi:hypothetical protein
MVLRATAAGLRRAARAWSLGAFLLLLNVLTAALLAVPLAVMLEGDLREREAASGLMYGFDYAWWSHWADTRPGWPSTLAPEILGTGFAFRNVDLLLKGQLPLGLFAARSAEAEGAATAAAPAPALDPVLLMLGAGYWLLQVLLSGGVLAHLRGPSGQWTFRGLLHGSGFYAGRFLRLALLVLLVDGLVFALNVSFARWVDHRARESVTDSAAQAWLLGRHALLLLALLLVHLVSSYARVIVVLEERRSALLALLSSMAFCVRHAFRTSAHLLAVVAAGVFLLALWGYLDGHWTATGYKTQAVTLLLAEGLIFGRILLRLALSAGQIDLYRALSAPPPS